MIRNPEMIREFEDKQTSQKLVDVDANFKVFEALWEHATMLKALPPKDPLDGLEVDLRLAEALNVR